MQIERRRLIYSAEGSYIFEYSAEMQLISFKDTVFHLCSTVVRHISFAQKT